MPLPRKIAKNVYDAFTGDNSWQKNVYKLDPKDANSYVADFEADGDLAGALSGKQHEKDRADKAERDLATMTTDRDTNKTKAEALETEKRAGWKKDPDRDAIETELRGKVTAAEQAAKDQKADTDKNFAEFIVTSEANKIAEEMSTYPTGFARELRDRLTVDVSELKPGQQPVIRVLDKDGKPSSASLAELRKEYVDSPSHKAIMKASDASGGGAGPGGNGGGGSASKAFKDMTEVERTQLFRSNPNEFNRLSQEHQAASAGYR